VKEMSLNFDGCSDANKSRWPANLSSVASPEFGIRGWI